jgi:hypothetical protein
MIAITNLKETQIRADKTKNSSKTSSLKKETETTNPFTKKISVSMYKRPNSNLNQKFRKLNKNNKDSEL